MKQVIQNFKNGEVYLEDTPPPIVKPNGILVNTYYSLISAGTEKKVIDLARKNYIGKAQERPDLVKQVLNKVKTEGWLNTYKSVMHKIETPLPLGNSCVGKVIAVGSEIDEINIGDYVACGGAGYANHAEINFVPKNLFVKIHNTDKLQELAFTTLGAIAIQGIRQAEVAFGETVAVIGLGLIGQLTIQLLKAAGCKVIGFEYDQFKIDLAKKNGLQTGVLLGNEDPVAKTKTFTNGYGVDKIIITASTDENGPVELAAEIARDRGTIVMVGVTGMDLPRKPYYDKELVFKFSRSYGPGRYDYQYEEKGIDYPIGYVRWTERRNMDEFVRLVEANLINVNPLLTHTFDFEDALKAYRMITDNSNREKYIGVLLQYPQNREIQHKISLIKENKPDMKDNIKIGLVGAGNFTSAVLMPEFSKIKGVSFIGIASAQGMHAKMLAKKYGFKYADSDYKEILGDQEINLVIITTTHNLHFPMIREAVLKGKDVYIEKPLCIKESELDLLIQLMYEHPERHLLVGFNRRFSRHIQGIKTYFKENSSPYIINYRINAGKIPKGHWINDPEIGGGRIIGEVCHFVDLAQYIIGSKPMQIFSQKASNSQSDIIGEDNFIATIAFEDGSVASIIYSSLGDKSYPKERLEIFCNGAVVNCDNFIQTTIWDNGKMKRIKTPGMDKGFFRLYSQYVSYLKGEAAPPISLEEAFTCTRATFKIKESLLTNRLIVL